MTFIHEMKLYYMTQLVCQQASPSALSTHLYPRFASGFAFSAPFFPSPPRGA